MPVANYGAAADVAGEPQPPNEEAAASEVKMEEGRLPPQREHHDSWDSNVYDVTKLTSWHSFTTTRGSAFQNKSVWVNVLRSFAIAVVTAVMTYFCPYADVIDTGRLLKLGTFLTVFVGFLLGFYLSSSMYRWYHCSCAYMELLDAVRQLQMQMTALGVARELKDKLNRYGLLSAWLLNLSLHMHAVKNPGEGKGEVVNVHDREHRDQLWERLDEVRPNLVRPLEKKILIEHQDAYALIWTWVASLIGRMAKDGDIPPMQSPTYGRILDLVQKAYACIREARSPFLVRAPFIYVHTLSILCHLNNILNAIVFGVLIGMQIPYLVMTEHQLEKGNYDEIRVPDTCADIFVALCLNMIAPMMYLTLLDTSTCMAQPFTFHDAKIPLQRFIEMLEKDLSTADLIADEPPLWDRPMFKK